VLPEEPTGQRDDTGSIVRWVRLSRQHRHSHSRKGCHAGPSSRQDHSQARRDPSGGPSQEGRGQRQANVDRAADRVADRPARPGVEDHSDIGEALDDGDIGRPRLRRSDRCPPGRAHGGRAPPLLRPGRDDLGSLALRAGWRAAGRLAQPRTVQGLGVAGGARSHVAQARPLQRQRPADGQNPRRRLTDGLAAVEAACVQALAEGVHSADVVLNIRAHQRYYRAVERALGVAGVPFVKVTLRQAASLRRPASWRRPIAWTRPSWLAWAPCSN
jgi:hypothetical protein